MNKIELEIVALSHSITQSHSYAVVLGEVNGLRRLPIVIGGFEAQAIAVALENIAPTRPLTHDLLKNTLDIFNIKLTEIIINNLQDGVFYAQLVCEKDGQTFEIDSRTSDALGLAVRFNCPIYTYEFILDSAGIILEESELEKEKEARETMGASPAEKPKKQEPIQNQSVDELKKQLQDALDKEDYERAAKIRDEINKRNEN